MLKNLFKPSVISVASVNLSTNQIKKKVILQAEFDLKFQFKINDFSEEPITNTTVRL